MSDKAYLANKYRFPIGKERYEFERVIDAHLNTLVERCRRAGPAKNGSGRLLDMLVLPEVFAAREYARNKLQAFSEEHDCTIVTGVDYPSLAKVHNANECFVIRPSEDIQVYRKITRSQYDAFAPDGTRMEMQRGETFLRFVENNGSGNGFGILICYDYSHLDLMAKINLKQRQHPLDFVVVTANNPFADLYRSCCIADSHRFYQYIVMCNVSKWGGSGVFGPVRTKGARQTLGEIGKGTEGILISELNLAKLRDERSKPDATVVQDPKDREFMRKPGIYQWGGIEDPD
jgi:predicted amidohydrolase